MAEKQNTPEIRFEGFTDPWEQRKLGEVAHRVIRKNEGNQSDLPLTISAQHGLVDQRDYFNSQVASRDMSGYYLLENGEFAYNKSTSADSPWGAIKRLTKYEKGCLSTLYICFRLDQGDPEFLVTYYETNRWHGAVQMIAAEGARNHGLLNIAPDDFFETALTLPCSTEKQRQIGCFFTQLNSLITLHQRKHDKLCTVKKSMLDKMFPKPGETEPEIRFKGFTDPWEQRKWSEYVSISTDMVDPRSGNYGNLPHVGPGNMESFTGRLYDNVNTVKDDALISGKFHFNPGDIIYGKINPQLGKYTYAQFEGLASADAYVLNGKNGLTQEFLFGILQTKAFFDYSVSVSMRSGMPKINRDELNAFEFLAPNESEQRAIGDILLKLDDLITLHQRKLDLLKNTKKSLLDKMFV